MYHKFKKNEIQDICRKVNPSLFLLRVMQTLLQIVSIENNCEFLIFSNMIIDNKRFQLNIFHVIIFKPSNSSPAAPILRITSFKLPEHYFISWIFYMPDCCQWLHYLPFQFIELNWNNVKVAIFKQKTCYMVMIRDPQLSNILQVV